MAQNIIIVNGNFEITIDGAPSEGVVISEAVLSCQLNNVYHNASITRIGENQFSYSVSFSKEGLITNFDILKFS